MFKNLKNLFKKNSKEDKQQIKSQLLEENADQDELDTVNAGLEIEETENWCAGSIYCHMFSKDPDQ